MKTVWACPFCKEPMVLKNDDCKIEFRHYDEYFWVRTCPKCGFTIFIDKWESKVE